MKPLKIKIAGLQFLQFLAWGSWLISVGAYCLHTKQWSASEFGSIFATIGIAALFMPTLAGIVADKWINAERLYAILQLGCAASMVMVPQMETPQQLFWLMLVNMLCYIPTISLAFSVSFSVMTQAGMNIVKEYPPLRVFGTLGFASGMWLTSLSGLETSPLQFYISAASSLAVAVLAMSMPQCRPSGSTAGSVAQQFLSFGKLFADKRFGAFFIFSGLLGVSMQLSNAYAGTFLHDFSSNPLYSDSIMIRFPAVIVSIGQMSEMFFVLLVPYFLTRYSVKTVMLISMLAWVARWLLLGFGNPGELWWMIILSMLVWGVAFDFFNLAGSLFLETNVDNGMKATAQGLLQVMIIGVGGTLGGFASGWMIDAFFTHDGIRDWRSIMIAFAAFNLLVAFSFMLFFKGSVSAKSPSGPSDIKGAS
ncbi:MFS transporter [Serratia sp. DD3]|uniref:MFS transporter n=1 Tax=Serratia sp. DD3 TaxID=1410619 RepID=UPI0003C50349|nr:MFS transporter [Serratia sp. DD3]KEY56442.1 nucleoside permease NupG [Serratia sp. DD3]